MSNSQNRSQVTDESNRFREDGLSKDTLIIEKNDTDRDVSTVQNIDTIKNSNCNVSINREVINNGPMKSTETVETVETTETTESIESIEIEEKMETTAKKNANEQSKDVTIEEANNTNPSNRLIKKKYDPYAVSRSSLKMKRKRNYDVPEDSSSLVSSLPTLTSDQIILTEAEQEFERKRRKIEEERLKEGAAQSYREKIHEFNEKASKSIDFHEMPKV